MRQLEYTKSDFGFEYHMVELLCVLNIYHYDYVRIPFVPQVAHGRDTMPLD